MKPCTGCGQCCKNQICKPGTVVYPNATIPCPGLVFEEGRHWCELIRNDPKIAEILGVGKGCIKNTGSPIYRNQPTQEEITKFFSEFLNSLS